MSSQWNGAEVTVPFRESQPKPAANGCRIPEASINSIVGVSAWVTEIRPEDIEILAEHFLARQAAQDGVPRRRLSHRCLECMRSRAWPGNVRELENFLERATLLKGEGEIGLAALLGHGAGVPYRPGCLAAQPPPSDLAEDREGPSPSLAVPCADAGGPWPELAQAEREHILRTLERTGFNQTAAARLLNIPRKQLTRKIKKHQIDVSRSHPGRPAK